MTYRMLYSRAKVRLATRPSSLIPKTEAWTGVAFTVLVGAGALAIGSTLNQIVSLTVGGPTFSGIGGLAGSLFAMGLVVLATAFLIYRLDLRTGTVKRRVAFLEVGWKNE